jgi:Ni,Fe-hydrogenase maturation factor
LASCGASGRVLVLALGNELLSDDAVALLAARELAGAVGEGVEVREAAQQEWRCWKSSAVSGPG